MAREIMTREKWILKRGQATTRDNAYSEGYAAKYHELPERGSPYPEGSELSEAYLDGYAEAVTFA